MSVKTCCLGLKTVKLYMSVCIFWWHNKGSLSGFPFIIKHFMQWVHSSEDSSKHCLSLCELVCADLRTNWLPSTVRASLYVGTRTCFCGHVFAYLTRCNQTELNTRRQIMGHLIYRVMRLWVCVCSSVCTNPPVIVANGWRGGHYTVENICVASAFFYFLLNVQLW